MEEIKNKAKYFSLNEINLQWRLNNIDIDIYEQLSIFRSLNKDLVDSAIPINEVQINTDEKKSALY